MKILLVEDDPGLSAAVADELRDELYAVDVAEDGETASELMAVNEYDGVVLDYQIPPPTGLELLKQWRQEGRAVPILMLTARASVAEKVEGLDAGADDYLTKPFSFTELKARVRSLLRRQAKPLTPPLRVGPLEMDRSRHQVKAAGQPVELSAKEFAILEVLLRRPGKVVSREEILEHAWESDYDSLTNIVDVFIHRLRRKIGEHTDEKLIHTIKGVGYRLGGDGAQE